MVWRSGTHWEVAAWWPHGGYGGVTICDSEVKALSTLDRMLASGYKTVHVRKVTVRVLDVGVRSLCEESA